MEVRELQIHDLRKNEIQLVYVYKNTCPACISRMPLFLKAVLGLQGQTGFVGPFRVYKLEATQPNLQVLHNFFVQRGSPNLEIKGVPQLFGLSRKGRVFLTDESDSRQDVAKFLDKLYRN
jgi:hypothetical protein